MSTATRKDKDNYLLRALRSLGYNFTAQDVEVILNVSDLIAAKRGDATLGEIETKRELALGLFQP